MDATHPGGIHPTAIVSPHATIAEDVQIGPFAVIDGNVTIGPGCTIGPYVQIVGRVVIGRNNRIFAGAVVGEEPQHVGYRGEATGVEIGDDNIIREHVTIHRGTTHSWTTVIGNGNFLMAGAHVAHDCRIGNRCILANNVLLGGHCVLEDNVFISGNSAVHQFIRIGRLAMLSGCSATSKDMPPFITQQGINNVVGVNVVGMRRAGMTASQINAVRRAYRIIFLQGLPLPAAIAKTESELGHVDCVQEMLTFLRKSERGICTRRARDDQDLAA